MAKTYDVAVIGLGAMGSAALYQLAKSGKSVIGIDSFAPPHHNGSHNGDSRITRQAIGEGAAYAPLALNSNRIWRELEDELKLWPDALLLHQVGCLVISGPDDRPDAARKRGFMQTTLAAAEAHHIPHERLSPAEVRRRYPQFAIGDGEIAYFEPGGGYLKPDRCIAAQLKLARKLGADIRTGAPVTEVRQQGDRVRIGIGDDMLEVADAVVTAGARTAKLLGAPFDALLRPTRQVMHWFALEPELTAAWQAGPTFIWLHDSPGVPMFYGFPDIGASGTIKAADESDSSDVDPDAVDRAVPEADSQRLFDQHIEGRLRGVSRRRTDAAVCLYTNALDDLFLIDESPQGDHILVVSPCSGHGFKHSAAIGEAVAERVLGRGSTYDLKPFSLAEAMLRLKRKSAAS